MSNPNETSTDSEYRQTRRNHLKGIAGVSAAALAGLGQNSVAASAASEKETVPHENICFTPTHILANQIRNGERSPTEAVDAFLNRIEERDAALNSFIDVFPDRARKAAQEAEQAIERGEKLGPLHGVPFGVKDLDGLEGTRYTDGSAVFADRIADETDPNVQAFIDAGAIPIGTTNTPEFGHVGKTDNLFAGPTSTPFAIGLNSGGSSGGSAAAAADGLNPFGTGGDGAGSIRIPASFTGTYGLFTGAEDPEDFDPESTHGASGVQTRTVEETVFTLDVMNGGKTDYQSALDRDIENLAIGYSPDLGTWPVDKRVRKVIEKNVDSITKAGAHVEKIDMDLGQSYEEFMEALQITWNVSRVKGNIETLEEEGYDPLGKDHNRISDSLLALAEDGLSYMEGREITDSAAEQALTARQTAFDSLQEQFKQYDLIVTSTLGVPPFSNDKLGPTTIEGVKTDPALGWLITATFNMTGHPAASVPAGLTADGLPIGMQIVGPPRDIETVIAASAAYERVNPWHDRYPGLT